VSLAKRIRWKLGLSQTEFAEVFRIPAGTLRDWEQHRREPDQADAGLSRGDRQEPGRRHRGVGGSATARAVSGQWAADGLAAWGQTRTV
jgi:hypothetical protein